MNEYDMAKGLREGLEKMAVPFDDAIIEKFLKLSDLLLEANQIHKFTTITDPKDITVKHYLDSVSAYKYLTANAKVLDLGAGAGFPSMPLKFIDQSLDFTLLDSLQKRVNYLENLIKVNSLDKIRAIHARCEDVDRLNMRESFDFVVVRGLASLPTLLEYAMPYLKVGGKLIAYKSEKAAEELALAAEAFKKLYCRVETVDEFLLSSEYHRTLIVVVKEKKTNICYPRIQNKPRTNPL